ncbi:GNAT family N-acetyltransferase [Aquimarina addita]|uniref:GNAT family N-acetyltransferase n=2 Tax=Aquimarina addita TaxID=870485 RepID=A0ABP7XAF2_9FLAO
MTNHLATAGLFLSKDEHLSRIALFFDTTFIIRIANKNAGMLKYVQNKEKTEIVQLQILPKYQGKGVGKYIVNYMIQKSLDLKSRLMLKVLKQNPAVRLYERCGFQIVDQDTHEFYMEYILDSTRDT